MSGNQVLKKTRKGTEYIEVNGEIIEKRCTGCGEMKELEQFTKNKGGLGGRITQCKLCLRERDKKYYEKNKEKISASVKKYREENKEQLKEYRKKYLEENREKNKEKTAEYWKKYYQENRERMLEYARKKREKDARTKNEHKKEPKSQ